MSSYKSSSSKGILDPEGNTFKPHKLAVNIVLTQDLRHVLQDIESTNRLFLETERSHQSKHHIYHHGIDIHINDDVGQNLGALAMLDLEEQLDYEPDGVESDDENESDNDSAVGDYSKNTQKYSNDFPSKENELRNKETNISYLQDQDCRSQFPEPSGQEDHESCNQASYDENSLSYGTDLENVRSVTSNYHSAYMKYNYNALHLDIEKDSFKNKFGPNSIASESVHIDSTDDEDEGGEEEEDINTLESPNNENTSSTERNYTHPESSGGLESPLLDHDNYSEVSENSQRFENMVRPRAIWQQSPIRDATTEKFPSLDDGNLNNIEAFKSVQKNKPTDNNITVSPPKKRASLNFSVKVVGNSRLCFLPKQALIKKIHKPWTSEVQNHLDNSELVRLTSSDDVIKFYPSIKIRLDEASVNSRTSDSSSELSLFKVPLKRPPTRQKGSSKNISVSVNLKSKEMTVTSFNLAQMSHSSSNNQDDNNHDDIISLIASTCQLSTADELEYTRDGSNKVVKTEALSLPGSSNATERAKMERTAQWVSNAAVKISVPSIYKGLCYNYFFSNRCNNKFCSRSHFLISACTQINRLQFLNIEELEEAYSFAKEHPVLYGHIYKHFAEAFALKDLKTELIGMVHILFDESAHNIDKKEVILMILNALQKTTLRTFEDSVEYLLLQIGLKRYPCLGNILLDIICKKPDMPHLWPIIRRLIIAGEKMTDKLATHFLVHLMRSPVNFQVCQEVYYHILKYKFTDLRNIANAIKEPFVKICSQENIARDEDLEATIERNLSMERVNFETSTKFPNSPSSQPLQFMPPDFSVPPPNFAGFERSQVPTRNEDLRVTVEGNLSKARLNFKNSSKALNQSLTASSRYQSIPSISPSFFLPPPVFDGVERSRLPTSHTHITSSKEFGSGLCLPADFASISRQSAAQPSQFASRPPAFGTPPRIQHHSDGTGKSIQTSTGDVDYRLYRRPAAREERSTNESSGGETSSAQLSDSDSFIEEQPSLYYEPPSLSTGTKRRRAPTGLMYNREGLQYDPANDYVPPPKKPSTDVLTEFNRYQERSAVNENMNQTDRNSSSQTNRLVLHRDSNNQMERTLSEFDRLGQSGGPSEWPQKANHNLYNEEASLQRSHHSVQEPRPQIHSPNYDERAPVQRLNYEEPSLQRPYYNIQEIRGPYHRSNNNNQGAGPSTENVNTRRGVHMCERSISNEAAVSSSSDVRLRDDKGTGKTTVDTTNPTSRPRGRF